MRLPAKEWHRCVWNRLHGQVLMKEACDGSLALVTKAPKVNKTWEMIQKIVDTDGRLG